MTTDLTRACLMLSKEHEGGRDGKGHIHWLRAKCVFRAPSLREAGIDANVESCMHVQLDRDNVGVIW